LPNGGAFSLVGQYSSAAEDLDRKLRAVESRPVSQALRNSDDKYFVEPYGAYLNLIWLNAEVGSGGGDVAGSADFAPSVTQLELLQTFEGDVASVPLPRQMVFVNPIVHPLTHNGVYDHRP
jgi:hypothetical protein